MRQPLPPRRPSLHDRRDARHFTLVVALIALAAVVLLAALIAPSTIPLNVLWPPMITLLTEAVRRYMGPQEPETGQADAKAQWRKATRLLQPLRLCVRSDALESCEINKRLAGLGQLTAHAQALKAVDGLGEGGAGGGEVALQRRKLPCEKAGLRMALSNKRMVGTHAKFPKLVFGLGSIPGLERERDQLQSAKQHPALVAQRL